MGLEYDDLGYEREHLGMTTNVERYVKFAIKHGEATENGNSEDANSAYTKLESFFAEIVESGERVKLVPLLRHENPAVRAHAAFHTYIIDAQRSESVLDEVASAPGLIGFSAGMTLKQLKSGVVTPK